MLDLNQGTLSQFAILWSFVLASTVSSIHTRSYRTPAHFNNTSCHCFPGDSCWPKTAEWADFNRTLGGKLVATIPIASVCHHDIYASYNADACRLLQSAWFLEDTHYDSSSSIMAPFFANQSCDPFLPEDARCIVGNYIQYAVNATGASDYQKTIEFVQRYNIRLTIRNTGHDYNGKATGAGAVGIWTHHMKEIQILDYQSKDYGGKAIKMGAGVQGYEASAAAHAQGFVLVGGNCPTVGIAGGYSQGGGHGPLASKFGLAADQVLEWEVVTGTGRLLRATPTENSDLYWALSGGGGGIFGVVLSMTSKVYKEMPSSASNLTFTNEGVSQDAYYDVVGTFHQILIPLVDAGGVSVWQFTNVSFSMAPTYGPNITREELQSILEPVINKLEQYKMNYTYVVENYSSFLDSYLAMNPPIPTAEIQIGGRLIPRSMVMADNSALTAALRTINEKGGGATGLALNVSHKVTGPVWNAVNPAWRDTLFDMLIYTIYDYADQQKNLANQRLMTNELVPQLEMLTPGGGAYLNEANFQQPNFQQTLYGANYDRLMAIKDKYDPTHMFYALTGVGSEYWTVAQDGRLCKSAA